MHTNDIFQRNLEAISGGAYKELKKELKNFKELRNFTYSIGNDPLDINIINKRNLKALYQNPLNSFKETINLYQDKYYRYSLLVFYGFGNGIFYKTILQNKNHKRIIIFEKELEIIFLIFNLIDFSQYLTIGKLIIVYTKNYDSPKANNIFSLSNIDLFLKTYNLNIHCDYYKKMYIEDINTINTINLNAIKQITLKKGNDPKDAMQGIEQTVYNLPNLIKNYPYYNILKKRKNIGKTAVIVSTGPSLTKQLSLLKKYCDKMAIFCADSSYSILYKNNIKPDYVVSLERLPLTSEFFNNDFGDFDKDILFILPSLTHPNSVKYLNKYKKSYSLVFRYLPFGVSLNLKEFGYIGGGMSVAHIAYELAILLGYENIILIGQDLAYSKEGKSHTDDYVNLHIHEKEFNENKGKFTTKAYGGKGVVESSEVWTLFRNIFQDYIAGNKEKIKTYNCTEGGARIEGAIEKPFKETCELLLSNTLKKPFPKLKKLPKQEQCKLMLQAYKKIKKNMSLALNFKKKCKKVLKNIQLITQKNQPQALTQTLKQIDELRENFENKKYYFLYEILGPTLHHEESILAPIYVLNVTNESEKQNKIFAWIYANESLIETIIDLIDAQDIRLKKAILPLQDELEKRNLI
ncbi:TPA: motility associated factor glycosyltransferase family protein [Campylobacter jejuni]|nr:motility associated factor glycosyltransferase family protein [Campylobacter jejuni]